MSDAPRARSRNLFAAVWLGIASLVLLGTAAPSDDRIQLFPQLQNGDTLRYESHARLRRYVKTKSTVVTMFEPKPVLADFSSNLQLSIQDFHAMDRRPMLAAETQLLATEPLPEGRAAPHPLKVNFAIGGDGTLTHADGLDDLDPEQRLAWQFWVAQFAFGWTLPPSGVKRGEKWKSVEAEKTPTPIANLVWDRETTYVQDDACPIAPAEQCAAFLTTATLRQKSKPEDATPEDYRLHDLKTSGTATGKNETVLYISRKTGLLMRATEDLQQSLDVTIAKTDGSNQIQYLVDVTSHFETVFVPPSPPPTAP
jgi:hypothetical protein